MPTMLVPCTSLGCPPNLGVRAQLRSRALAYAAEPRLPWGIGVFDSARKMSGSSHEMVAQCRASKRAHTTAEGEYDVHACAKHSDSEGGRYAIKVRQRRWGQGTPTQRHTLHGPGMQSKPGRLHCKRRKVAHAVHQRMCFCEALSLPKVVIRTEPLPPQGVAHASKVCVRHVDAYLYTCILIVERCMRNDMYKHVCAHACAHAKHTCMNAHRHGHTTHACVR